MINLFFIKTFITVAQTGSFRLAASKNNITQPAVSQHILTLERKLNCTLFERSNNKKIILTPEGQIFMTYAQQIMDLYQNAKSKIQENRNRYAGAIHIMSIYTMGLYQLKPILQKMMKKYPEITVNLEYGHHEMIYEAIKKGTADFGLVAFPKEMAGCTIKTFTDEDLVLVQAHDSPFLKKKTVQVKDLIGISFVGLDTKTPTGKAIEDYFLKQDINLKIVKMYENIETIKNAVEVGIGCAILPKLTIIQEVKRRKFDIIHVKNMNIKRPLAIIYNNKKVFSKSTQLFYEMVCQTNKSGSVTYKLNKTEP